VVTSGIQDKPEDAPGQGLGPDQGLGSRGTTPSPVLAKPTPVDKTAVPRTAVGGRP
jgi:hypothetical protein